MRSTAKFASECQGRTHTPKALILSELFEARDGDAGPRCGTFESKEANLRLNFAVQSFIESIESESMNALRIPSIWQARPEYLSFKRHRFDCVSGSTPVDVRGHPHFRTKRALLTLINFVIQSYQYAGRP
jgi:hypothetical protein